MFIGNFELGSTMRGLVGTLNSSGVPTAADSLPTFRIYCEGALMPNGTGTTTAFDAGTLIGVYQFTKALNSGDGYERGRTCFVVVQATVGGAARTHLFSFGVI